MPMLAEVIDAVVGGDTHRDTHSLEIAHPSGAVIATTTITNDDAGFAQALTWIAEHTPGPRVVIGLEGTRSYGIGLSRALMQAGMDVVEVLRPRRGQRRRGKSDPIDAHLAVLAVLQMDPQQLPTPRADGDREALRILLGARQEMVVTRTRQTNRLRALLLAGEDTDRNLARGTMSKARLLQITRRRARANETTEQAIRRQETHRLARAIITATEDLTLNKKALQDIVTTLAPALLDKTGIGPVSAAQAIVSWSHHGRCRDEAAFAALAGACPLPASSGLRTRHRLNRGGDRQLNRALHDITLTRWRICPRTRTYIERRRAEGKSDREIRRCLKRHIARELYKTLEATPRAA